MLSTRFAFRPKNSDAIPFLPTELSRLLSAAPTHQVKHFCSCASWKKFRKWERERRRIYLKKIRGILYFGNRCFSCLRPRSAFEMIFVKFGRGQMIAVGVRSLRLRNVDCNSVLFPRAYMPDCILAAFCDDKPYLKQDWLSARVPKPSQQPNLNALL